MSSRKKIILIMVIVLLLGGVGVFFWKRSQGPVDVIKNNTNVEQGSRSNELNALNQSLEKMRLNNKDLDGLSDVVEAGLGTDPAKADTDGDGINDGDEIMIWKTNPLKADTDGDGKNDGYEVMRGLDPLKK